MPLAWLTFAIGVAYLPGLPSNAVVGRWGVWAVGIAIILWTIRIRPGPAHWMGAALLAWIAAGFAWAVSAWDHAAGLWQWTMMAAAFCVGAETESMAGCWRALAIAAWLSAVVAAAQAAGFAPVANVTEVLPVGLMLTKNMAAELAVLGLIGAVAVRSWPLAIGPAVLLALAQSRAGAAAIAAAAVTAAWCSSEGRERTALGVGLGVAAVVGLAVVARFNLPMFSLADRWPIWSLFLPAVTVWGDGLGSVAVAAPRYEFAHNEFIHYAFELGAGSLLIWGIVVYALGAQSTSGRAAMAAIVAFALVWFPLHGPTTAFVAALLAGHLAGLRDRARRAQSAGRADRRGSLPDAEPIGIGAISAADFGRLDLSARPQFAVGGAELRAALQHHRDGARP